MFCTSCGKTLPDFGRFCTSCGAAKPENAASVPPSPMPTVAVSPFSSPPPAAQSPPPPTTSRSYGDIDTTIIDAVNAESGVSSFANEKSGYLVFTDKAMFFYDYDPIENDKLKWDRLSLNDLDKELIKDRMTYRDIHSIFYEKTLGAEVYFYLYDNRLIILDLPGKSFKKLQEITGKYIPGLTYVPNKERSYSPSLSDADPRNPYGHRYDPSFTRAYVIADAKGFPDKFNVLDDAIAAAKRDGTLPAGWNLAVERMTKAKPIPGVPTIFAQDSFEFLEDKVNLTMTETADELIASFMPAEGFDVDNNTGVAVPWDNQSLYVFALWPDDGSYYPAKITSRVNDQVNVLFFDHQHRMAKAQELINKESIFTMITACDRDMGGMFYPCKISITPDKRFEAKYQDDGTKAIVEMKQFQIRS